MRSVCWSQKSTGRDASTSHVARCLRLLTAIPLRVLRARGLGGPRVAASAANAAMAALHGVATARDSATRVGGRHPATVAIVHPSEAQAALDQGQRVRAAALLATTTRAALRNSVELGMSRLARSQSCLTRDPGGLRTLSRTLPRQGGGGVGAAHAGLFRQPRGLSLSAPAGPHRRGGDPVLPNLAPTLRNGALSSAKACPLPPCGGGLGRGVVAPIARKDLTAKVP
jgi:hypothetical protein